MSQVKKLAPGGIVSKEALEEQLLKELPKYKLKSKDQIKVRNLLTKIRDTFSNPENGTVEFDPVTNTYTVPEKFKQDFAGSQDDVKTSWWTKNYKIKDDQDAMSIAMSIYGNALKNVKKTPVQTETKPTYNNINIASLEDFINNTKLATEYDLENTYSKFKNNEDIKNFVFENANELLQRYNKNAEKNNLSINPDYKSKLDAVAEAIRKKDWDSFVAKSKEINWTPNQFLLTQEVWDKIAEKEREKSALLAEKERYNRAQSIYSKYNISDEVKSFLNNYGFTQVADNNWLPSPEATWWPEIAKKHNAITWYNPTNKTYLVTTPTGFFDFGIENQLHPGFGYSWTNKNGRFEFFTPSRHQENPDVWSKDIYTNNVGREIITDVPGYSVIGYSGENQEGQYAKNSLGRRDFTKNLVIKTPNNQTINVYKGNNNKYYLKDTNQEYVLPFKMLDLGNQVTEVIDYDKDFPNINVNNYREELKTENTDKNIIKLSEALYGKTPTYGKELTKAAAQLKWALANDPTVKNDTQRKKKIYKLVADYHKILPPTQIKKTGGIIKMQNGNNFAEYRRKILAEQANKKQNEELNTETAINIDNTWKGKSNKQKALTGLSMAGDLAAFAPGPVGAVGASVAAAANIANRISKDGFQWNDVVGKDALMDYAFIGLSTIGLGGVKNLIKAGKMAQKGVEAGEIIQKVSRIPLKGSDAKGVQTFTNFVTENGLKSSDAAKLLDEAKKLNLAEEELKDLEKGIDVVKRIWSSPTPILRSNTLGAAVKSAGELINKTPKIVITGARIATVAPATNSAFNIIKDTKTRGDISYTNPEDWTNLMRGIAVGKNWATDWKATRAFKRQAIEIPEVKKGIKNVFKKSDVKINFNPEEVKHTTGNVYQDYRDHELVEKILRKMNIQLKSGGKIRKMQDGKTVNPNAQDTSYIRQGVLDNSNELLANIFSAWTLNKANKASGQYQRNAVVEGIYTLPSVPYQNYKISSPYLLLGEKQANNLMGAINRAASSVADIDKAASIKLEGLKNANAIRDKYNSANQEYISNLNNAQTALNAKTAEKNAAIAANNAANIANARKQINLVNANETLTNAQNISNLAKYTSRWTSRVNKEAQENENTEKLFNLLNDEEYQNVMNEYQEHVNTIDRLKQNYIDRTKSNMDQDAINNTDWDTEFQNTDEYKNWLKRKEELETKKKTLEKKWNTVQTALFVGMPLSGVLKNAKGGGLTDAGRIEAEKIRSETRYKMKDMEIFYKTIQHDNELLIKSLIKIFK